MRRLVALSGWAVVALWTSLAIASLSMLALGHRPLVVDGDSMEPAVSPGDVVVNASVPAADARAGDIVTFSAPEVALLTTHRVMEVSRRGTSLEFVTKGDANLGAERWTAAQDARIGRVIYRIPMLGYLLRASRSPVGQIGLLAGAALMLGALLALIWRPAGAPAGWPLHHLQAPARGVDIERTAGDIAP